MDQVDRWQSRTESSLAVCALLFLGAYAWPILDPGLSSGWKDSCLYVNYAVWAVFIADYLIRLALVRLNSTYILRHIPDLLMIALPVLRQDAERHSHAANIRGFGDALWWATTTMSTVGYGDRYPVTTEGRFVAGFLMLAGVALIGVVTASIASWLIDRVQEVEAENQAATREDIAALRSELQQLRASLARNGTHAGGVADTASVSGN